MTQVPLITTVITTVISMAALAVSLITAWLTLFRRGTVCMTHPTVIYFGPQVGADPRPKVYFRALLFSTAKRGRVIESMYVRLRHDDAVQDFPVWVYGEAELMRGSGLFVPENGVVWNHHFLLSVDNTSFAFHEGEYAVEVFAAIFGKRENALLFDTTVHLQMQEAVGIAGSLGVYFDWSPDTRTFQSHLRPLSAGASPAAALVDRAG